MENIEESIETLYDNLPEWITDLFDKHNKLPRNIEEADEMLNDILEIDKRSLFNVSFVNDKNEKIKIELTKENAIDIFYAPIWKNANLKTRANCIKWVFDDLKIKLKLPEDLTLTFVSEDEQYNAFYVGKENLIYINLKPTLKNELECEINPQLEELYKTKYDLSCHNTLSNLRHELQHALQNKTKTENTEILLNTEVGETKNVKYNCAMYLINPLEEEARLYADKFRTDIHYLLSKKYGESSLENYSCKKLNEIYCKEEESINNLTNNIKNELIKLKKDYLSKHEQIKFYNAIKETFINKLKIEKVKENDESSSAKINNIDSVIKSLNKQLNEISLTITNLFEKNEKTLSIN